MYMCLVSINQSTPHLACYSYLKINNKTPEKRLTQTVYLLFYCLPVPYPSSTF